MIHSLLRILGVYKGYERYLKNQIAKGDPPEHVGIILDGNRRWARSRSFPDWIGHHIGARNVDELLEWCHDLGIRTITIYALSTENLSRPSEELQELLALIREKLEDLLKDQRIHAYEIKVKGIGRRELLPDDIVRLLNEVEDATKEYSRHYLNVALAYGGRTEIVDGVKKIAEEVHRGALTVQEIDQKTIGNHLYTSHLPNPEPDLVVRTSGEERTSGFLLWQSAYSELVFVDVYWPDFRKIDLMRAIRTYQKRVRRFGK